MTEEKRERIINIIKVTLILGLTILGVLIIVSIVGIILSLRKVCDLLEVSSSVFVAAISSLLTVLALVLTVNSSNKTIELQRKTIELQLAGMKDSINLICNNLYLESIEINKCSINKPITHNSCYQATAPIKKLRMGLYFSTININELSGISLQYLGLYFKYKMPNNESINIVINDLQSPFYPFEIKSENKFLYEVIIPIDKSRFQNIQKVLNNTPKCFLEIKARLVLKSNGEMVSSWVKTHSLLFQQVESDKKAQKFLFMSVNNTIKNSNVVETEE